MAALVFFLLDVPNSNTVLIILKNTKGTKKKTYQQNLHHNNVLKLYPNTCH